MGEDGGGDKFLERFLKKKKIDSVIVPGNNLWFKGLGQRFLGYRPVQLFWAFNKCHAGH